MTGRSLALVALCLAAGPLAGCDLGGGPVTPSAVATTSSPAPTPSATGSASPVPTVPLSDVVPVIECPTSYGIANPGPSGAAYPTTIALNIPATSAEQLAAYSDDYRDLTPVLGPRGWSCSVSIGADGSTGVVIHPAAAATPTPGSEGQMGPPLVSAHSDSACMGCIYQTVCPFVPGAATELGYQGWACSNTPPTQETVRFANGSPTTSPSAAISDVIDVTDPPGVPGDADGSGGPDTAEGVILYNSVSDSAAVGQTTYASQESCALSASDQDLCSAIIDDFVFRAWLMGE